MMRLLILSNQDQIGYSLINALGSLGQVFVFKCYNEDKEISKKVCHLFDIIKPDTVINAINYDIRLCDGNESNAQLINSYLVDDISIKSRKNNCLLIHYSSYCVFDGMTNIPYSETAATNPISMYGQTKLASEEAITANGCRSIILRMPWIYSEGSSNFVNRTLEWAHEKKRIAFLKNEFGQPTWVEDIALATSKIIERSQLDILEGTFNSDILHLAAEGKTSRYALGEFIINHPTTQRLGVRLNQIDQLENSGHTQDKLRPAYGCLNTNKLYCRFGIKLGKWDTRLYTYLEKLQSSQSLTHWSYSLLQDLLLRY